MLPTGRRPRETRPCLRIRRRWNYVTLLHEESVSIDPDGHRVMRERGAVRILQTSSDTIEAYRTYDTKTGRIRDFQGWLISPSGSATAFAKNRILDVALSRDYVYDETRAKVLECGAAAPGSVFAWEIVEEDRSVMVQDEFRFQSRMPVLTSRFSVTLPATWEAKGIVLNAEKVEPRTEGTTWTWEMQNLPWIDREEHSPAFEALVPQARGQLFPADGQSSRTQRSQGLGDGLVVAFRSGGSRGRGYRTRCERRRLN